MVLSTLACGGNVEMELGRLEGWVSRLGWENIICQECVHVSVCVYICMYILTYQYNKHQKNKISALILLLSSCISWVKTYTYFQSVVGNSSMQRADVSYVWIFNCKSS